MITADQLTVHAIGDYILQSDWMANNKTKSSLAAAIHAICYSAPFLLFRPSAAAFALILVTHFFIDRFRLARYVVWVKNSMDPGSLPWMQCENSFGYPPDRPVWLAFWLLIIADNIMHVVINGAALKYL